jgi:hypothetical protein
MQRRNGRAQQLRVIQVAEGNYFVESSDGKIAYKAALNGDKAYCTCLDFHKHSNDPDFRCKHLFAIMNCLPEGKAEQKEFLKKRQPKLDERFIKNIEGKDFVLYAGLLDLAHQKGLTRMAVEVLQFPTTDNGHMAIVKAQAESRIGEIFMDVGDATPNNCNSKVAKHLLRMASTRAKARALRDMTNIGMTCLEELADLNDVAEEGRASEKASREAAPARKGKAPKKKEASKPKAQAPESTAPPKAEGQVAKMSVAQERAINNLAQRRGLNQDELDKLALDAYGTVFNELTTADASQMIRHLQQSA